MDPFDAEEEGNRKKTFFHLLAFLKKILKTTLLRKLLKKESLKELIEYQENSEEHELIKNFMGRLVSDIMIPRTSIKAINITENKITLQDLPDMCTRTPVYQSTLDEIIGFVHIKNLASATSKNQNIEGIIRKIITIPPSMKVMDLLIKMQSHKTNIAVVLDEYGCTDGLVTIEEIIKAIAGNVENESSDLENITSIGPNKFEINAKTPVAQVEKSIGISLAHKKFESENIETLGGLVLLLLGRLPKKGEIIRHPVGIIFNIKDSDTRRINKLIIDTSNGKKHKASDEL